jgi:hypothetical protein
MFSSSGQHQRLVESLLLAASLVGAKPDLRAADALHIHDIHALKRRRSPIVEAGTRDGGESAKRTDDPFLPRLYYIHAREQPPNQERDAG